MKQRHIIGDKVWIRKQPNSPPPSPHILLLSDQMVEGFQIPDRYIHPNIMVGYSIKDFTNDIRDSAIDLNYPYILVFLGSLQLSAFDSRDLHKQVGTCSGAGHTQFTSGVFRSHPETD